MTSYVLRRLAQSVIVVWGATVAIFLLIHTVPGDPARMLAGPDASPATVAAVRHDMGLDRPLPAQYWEWLIRAVHGDLGTSLLHHVPVAELIGQRLPATFELALAALLIAVVAGMAAGLVAASRPGGLVDAAISGLNGIALSVPNFWLGILGIMCFALWLGWLPAGGRVPFLEDPVRALPYLLLPAITLAIAPAAIISRLVRSSMLDEMSHQYVVVARAKGVRRRTIVRRHVLRNALVPVVTVIGLRFGDLVGGAVIIESVFSWPGLGRLMVDAIANRDIVIVQGALLWLVIAYLLVNLLTDLTYGLLNPRIRINARQRA